MNDLNEKLAELCGLTRIKHRGSYCDSVWQSADGSDPLGGHFDSDNDWLQNPWNPTADLNQLKMCYEALSEDEKKSFAFNTRYAPTDRVFTNPELVAQDILKAKGVI